MTESSAKAGSTARKGSIHFIKTDRGLFPLSTLQRFSKASADERGAESKQLREEERYMTEKGLVPLPFNVYGLLHLLDNCTYFDACVRQIAKDVVGQGWDLVPSEEGEEMSDEEYDTAFELLDDPSTEDESLEDIIERCIIDRSAIGWMTLEVSRDAAGKVNGLFHLPSWTIRVHKSRTKYCQIRGMKKRWFKRFDHEDDIHQDTGEPGKGLKAKRANELIFDRNYYIQSEYYGAPPILPAVGAVRGLIGVRDYNLAFFDNYGIPAALVVLEGDWEEGSAKDLSDFLDVEIKRSENAHKTMVAELPSGGKLTWQPLGVEVKEGSFNVYLKEVRNESLASYKMPPYRIGIVEVGALGENVADEATRIYISSVINPLKKATGNLITRLILHKGLELKTVSFKFNELDTRNLDSLTARWERLFGMAAINANFIRAELGLDAEEHGKQYYISSQYLPAGEETLERREKALEATFGKLQAKVDSLVEEARKARIERKQR